MSNKTIEINPAIFNIGGSSKTKKNRDKNLNNVKPLISPNILKNKLLKRIKEHKLRETNNLDNKKLEPKMDILNNKEYVNNLDAYTDEFNDSISYLQTLSKQKKLNDEKANYERNKQKKILDLQRQTIKNYHSNDNYNSPIVNIELPEELKYSLVSVDTEQIRPDLQDNIILKTYRNDNIPYGILKGGNKPTYRDWNKTQRNINSNIPILNIENSINTPKSERENRLNILKEKIKQRELLQNNISSSFQKPSIPISNNLDTIMLTQHLIQKPKQEIKISTPEILHTSQLISNNNNNNNNNNNQPNNNQTNNNQTNNNETNNNQTNNNQTNIPIQNINNKLVKKKTLIKRIISKKYTLGKSKIKNIVSILLKDRGTRKKIINASRDIKHKNINEVKLYLRDHNLIKIGSTTPNDIIRKLYESSMLAGEITNTNKDTLLYNILQDDKEL